MTQADATYAPEICLYCQGEGAEFWRKGEFHPLCPICRGAGSLLVAQPALKCAFCRGASSHFWRNDHHYLKCPTCKGAGWAHARLPG